MVKKLHTELKIPVTCKIRCLKTEAQTLELAKAIEEAGASLLTVHGRLKEHNKQRMGTCNYAIIKRIKQELSIPVVANGGISTFEDAQRALELTGCDGVMSSEAILENAALFSGEVKDMDELTLEYLDLYEKYPGEGNRSILRAHLFKFLHEGLRIHTDLRDRLARVQEVADFRAIAEDMQSRRKDMKP